MLQMGQRVRLLAPLERDGGAVVPAGTIGVVSHSDDAPRFYVVDIVVDGDYDYVFAAADQVEAVGPDQIAR